MNFSYFHQSNWTLQQIKHDSPRVVDEKEINLIGKFLQFTSPQFWWSVCLSIRGSVNCLYVFVFANPSVCLSPFSWHGFFLLCPCGWDLLGPHVLYSFLSRVSARSWVSSEAKVSSTWYSTRSVWLLHLLNSFRCHVFWLHDTCLWNCPVSQVPF